MAWKQYAPDDPKGLRPFVEDLVNRMIKAGVLTIRDVEEAKKREDQVWDEMMKELKEHIGCAIPEECRKTDVSGKCVCRRPASHEGLCKCSICGGEFEGEWSTENEKRGY
jgi:hypothetical protein